MLYYSNISINHCLIEFTSTLFSLLLLILIITPALIILLDFDVIVLPSFIIYSLGLQWAWQFNIIFLPVNIGFESYCDHYIISTNNKKPIDQKLFFYWFFFKGRLINNSSVIQSLVHSFINHYSLIHNNIYLTDNSIITRYLFEISQYILLPIYSFILCFNEFILDDLFTR